ncbi:DUF6492 family protein [Pseudomonas sp. Leaf129]|uniref:DUF6492 family protein n=1 Tax=Pseudomonas sp. Leaf129 TaxID=1736268 RepID=UPI000B257EAF|nr:DUF6492 family protein [Pseudomonas sp. Leaf129]
MSVEIHTITFDGDLRLFELQALSIDQLLDHSQITKYRIIINDQNEMHIRETISSFIDRYISVALRRKIEILSSSKYLTAGMDGWKDQQYLKLFSVADSVAKWVVVLDSKNHFVKHTTINDFFQSNKAKTYFCDPPTSQLPWLHKSLAFFHVSNFQLLTMPTVTPYTMKPSLVRLMINAIRTDPRIHDKQNIFSSPSLEGVSEFFLYYAFLLKLGSIDDYYHASPRLCETLYTVWPQDRGIVKRYLSAVASGEYHVFGLHRKRLPQLSADERQMISNIWKVLRLPLPASYYLEFTK